MKARLTITAGEGAPLWLDIQPNETVTLGRHRTNRVVLRDLHASRHHAELLFEDGQWLLRDCSTLNGTRLNGQRIHSPRPLKHGQEIGIGETRLTFTGETTGTGSGEEAIPIADSDSDSHRTALKADELTVLCTFMNAAVEETSPRSLIERALALVHSQTWATLTGFLSLDSEEPLPQIVLPDKAGLDVALSRQMTRAVQRQGHLVWLAARPPEGEASDSLAAVRDAVCVPMRAFGTALGALHVYKANRHFTEREVRFIEVLAAYLAKSLHVLRARRTLAAENVRLRSQAKAAAEEMVGSSAALEQVRQQVDRLGPHDCTVLITGESGVGKELVALELHRNSERCDGPLVILNCGAITPTLLESELFGHVKGAFTGADREKPGCFEQADYGTLFLDEIGDMSPECQVKFLRVLEDKPFRKVGGTQDVRVDVRIIAATHRDLDKMVRDGKFRHDLFYRLGVRVHVPPLRERPEDVEALTRHFLAQLSAEYHRPLRLTLAACTCLRAHPWPGNVRQLRAVLEMAAAMSDGSEIDVADLSLHGPAGTEAEDDLNLDRREARAIREALRRSAGHLGTTAELLGVHRDTLRAKMTRYGIAKTGE